MNHLLGVLILTLGLAACGSPGTPPGTESPPPPPPPPPPVTVARLIIGQTSALLEGTGATQRLSVQALDAQDRPVSSAVSWVSDEPDIASVSPDGTLSGVKVGSTLIRARVGTTLSAPVVVAVGALIDGVVRVPTDKVVSGPVFSGGSSPLTIGSTYTAVLKDVSPTAGKLWFSKTAEGVPIQGKVLSSRAVATGQEVTLEVVPMNVLFKQLSVNEEFDLPASDLIVPEALKAAYTVSRQADGTLDFTPRSNLSTAGVHPQFAVGPFECSGSLSSTIFNPGTPSFSLNMGSPHVTFAFDLPIPFVTAGRLEYLFTASPSLTLNSGANTLLANFADKTAECALAAPLEQGFGFLGFDFKSRLQPVMTYAGSNGAGQRTVRARLATNATLRLGLRCAPPAGCTNLTTGNTATVTGSLIQSGSGDLLGHLDFGSDLQLRHSLVATGFDQSIDLFRSRARLAGRLNLRTMPSQISLNTPSSYQLTGSLKVDPLAAIQGFVRLLLGPDAAASLPDVNLTLFTLISPRVQAASFTTAKNNNQVISVKLDPDQLNFLGVGGVTSTGYNVRKVQLIETAATGAASVRAEALPGASGDSTFSFQVSPTTDMSRLSVFVVPVIMEDVPLGMRGVSQGIALP